VIAPSPASRQTALKAELREIVGRSPIDLVRAALTIAKLEHPHLDPAPSLDQLRRLGAEAGAALAPARAASIRTRIALLNHVLFERHGFAGNHAHYDDYRNSLINVVLERRLGIPITLAVIYIDVARQAGVDVQGVAFPGHFLMHVPDVEGEGAASDGRHARGIVLDPFDGGRELSDEACHDLLRRALGDDVPYHDALLRPCTGRALVARLLNNLKRTYVEQRSFAHARLVSDLLLEVDPTLVSELRDRGLLAYHLDDYPAALRDLESYVRRRGWRGEEGDEDEERAPLLEHIRALRRRVAGLN
jgi:regulator of sirC expression with transglutaminase-like and TPR domain